MGVEHLSLFCCEDSEDISIIFIGIASLSLTFYFSPTLPNLHFSMIFTLLSVFLLPFLFKLSPSRCLQVVLRILYNINQQAMVFLYTVSFSLSSLLLLYHNQSIYIYLVSFLLTAIYYASLYMDVQIKIGPKLRNGELIHQMGYMLWMYLYPQKEFMFFVPFVLSNIGKIYALFHQKDDDNQTIIEELIKFQVKLQFFLMVILIIKLIHPSLDNLLSLLFFAVLCKIKYSFYFAAQRAYVELHFLMDNLTKKWGARKAYHFMHNIISFFGGVSNSSKEIGY